jgi:hypothetical protein
LDLELLVEINLLLDTLTKVEPARSTDSE